MKKKKLWADVNGQSSTNNSSRLTEGDIQHELKKSHDVSRDDTTDIWHFKKLCFWRNHKQMFNWLNSVSWIKLGVVMSGRLVR